MRVNEAAESLTLEFKRDSPAGDRRSRAATREAARDVAQFANGVGGTLLFGVDEGPGQNGLEVAAAIPGVAEADSLREWIETKVRTFLVPSDLAFETLVLAVEARSFIEVPTVRLHRRRGGRSSPT